MELFTTQLYFLLWKERERREIKAAHESQIQEWPWIGKDILLSPIYSRDVLNEFERI
jgi:hypothetical protein